jgi:hypothetical protein
MRLDSKSGVRGVLLNAETGQPIRWAKWAEIPDDPSQPGEFEAFREEPTAAAARGIPATAILYRGRCRLRFIPAAPRFGTKPSAVRDLVGSLDEARRRVDKRLLILSDECDEPGCHRWADWQVAHEQLIEPEVDAQGKRHERAVTVKIENWCAKHYRPPVQTNQRGVESEVEVEARPE